MGLAKAQRKLKEEVAEEAHIFRIAKTNLGNKNRRSLDPAYRMYARCKKQQRRKCPGKILVSLVIFLAIGKEIP